jgi:hypothetical protein
MYIRLFCKIKNITVPGWASTTGRGNDPSPARRSCHAGPGTIKMGHASGQPARHILFGHLYLCTITMVLDSVTATSFVILLLFSLLSCIHLRATPFSAEGVGAGASSLYSSDISSDTDPRSGYCTSTRTFHSMRAPFFSPSLDILFVFLAFALFFLPNLLPRPRSQP